MCFVDVMFFLSTSQLESNADDGAQPAIEPTVHASPMLFISKCLFASLKHALIKTPGQAKGLFDLTARIVKATLQRLHAFLSGSLDAVSSTAQPSQKIAVVTQVFKQSPLGVFLPHLLAELSCLNPVETVQTSIADAEPRGIAPAALVARWLFDVQAMWRQLTRAQQMLDASVHETHQQTPENFAWHPRFIIDQSVSVIGAIASRLLVGDGPSEAETSMAQWLQSPIFAGGVEITPDGPPLPCGHLVRDLLRDNAVRRFGLDNISSDPSVCAYVCVCVCVCV
jgi:hypothetical protein